uniref:RING-type domain-containing protein n=1 Tax=Mesocestoides corti TaxID=53468 RepID=A0A5K3EQI0_MESCO
MFSRSDCWMSTPERRSAARGGRTVGSECAHTAIREFCAGITSRPDSGFSDQNTPLSDTMAFSNVVRDPADTSLVDSMFQSSPAGFRPPIARSSNQESPKPWCPLFRLIEPQPMALRGATPIRTFRPRSAPLAVEGFSLPEEDEEEEEEEESRSGSDERPPEVAGAELPQTSTGHRDASPPPPAVFIPRDQRQARASLFDLRRRLRRSSVRHQAIDLRSVATQTPPRWTPPGPPAANSVTIAYPLPTAHPRRRLLVVRPQSAPLYEEGEAEWRHQLLRSSVCCCCRCCSRCHHNRAQHRPLPLANSSSIFGEEFFDLPEDVAGSSCMPDVVPMQGAAGSSDDISSSEQPDDVFVFPESSQIQRPAFVRLRSASAPIDDNGDLVTNDPSGEDYAPRLRRHMRRRLRRHSYHYENLASIAQRMADAGDAFDLEHRLSISSATSFFELGRRSSSLQWLSSSFADLVSRPIGALRRLWELGSFDADT